MCVVVWEYFVDGVVYVCMYVAIPGEVQRSD